MKKSLDKSTLKLQLPRNEPSRNIEENTDILQSAQTPLTPETSPRYSPNREPSDHRESRSPRKMLKESRLRMIEHSRQSEDTVSLKSSPRREGRLPLKKYSSSDPSETANVSSQLTRKKNSHSETIKSGNEPGSSDSGSALHKQISRSKSPEKSGKSLSPSDDSETPVLKPARLSSPRSELIKSVREEGFFKQHAKKDSSSISDASTPKIVVPPKRCSASREHKNEPKKCYELHLKTLISERTDEHFHGRVLAYFDPNLLRTIKPHSVYEHRHNFANYFKYITEELNELQREKFTNIELLVELLNPVYSQVRRTEKNHDNFCQNLLEIIQCCMATNCTSTSYLPDSKKTPEEKILIFWEAAYENLFYNDDASKKYIKLITTLHIQIKKGFLMSDTLNEIKNIQSERSTDENPFCCISWNYLYVLCDSRYLPVKLDDCKTLYNQTCHGLANEFIFVPHLWSFIRDTLDKESRHHSPYHETFKNLDKLLLETPVFSDFKPENHHSHRWVF